MDRRLSGALAWGLLAVIIVGPGAELLTRKSPSESDPISASTVAPATDTQSAAVATNVPPDSRVETLGPPPPPAEAPDAALAEDVAAVDPQPKPDPVAETELVPVADAPETATATPPDDAALPADPPPETAAIAPPTDEAEPVAIADLPVTPVDRPDAAEIAARVRALVLSDTAEPAPEHSLASASGTVFEPLPEKIPYPAPAEQRPRQRVVAVVAPPKEPVPDIRPDNAIFFQDWTQVPPRPFRGIRY